MKVLFLALAVMVLAAVLVWTGNWYIEKVCRDLTSLVDTMPEQMGATAAFGGNYRKFEERWKNAEVWVQILVGHEETDKVTELAAEMAVRYLANDTAGYKAGKERLRMQLKKIREGEEISADNIL